MGELIDKTKGKIKQAIGALTGDKDLKREGERDETKGKVEGAVERVKDAGKAIKDAVK
ncbi:MAG: CsbD family protein [Betaproteobacteria bacterium]